MRLSNLLVLFTTTSILLLVWARHHLRELAEVARTYATFYPYIKQHPETLYRYSPRSHPEQPFKSNIVPQDIHQIFLTEGRETSSLDKYSAAMGSCKQLHADWTHRLWTDHNASAFISEHYPHIAPHYVHYKQSIQRANILRYALLDHFGGVYLDLDVACLEPLDSLRSIPLLTPGAYPAGVNNAFILSRTQQPFWKHLLSAVESRDLSWGLPYVENMLSTGCMFVSNRWMSYVRSLGKLTPAEDKVYILADDHGHMDPHMLRGAVTTPLFRHGGASSWHGWDAAAIVMIGKHYCYFLATTTLGAVCAIALIWKAAKARRVRAAGSNTGRVSVDRYSDKDEEWEAGLKEG